MRLAFIFDVLNVPRWNGDRCRRRASRQTVDTQQMANFSLNADAIWRPLRGRAAPSF